MSRLVPRQFVGNHPDRPAVPEIESPRTFGSENQAMCRFIICLLLGLGMFAFETKRSAAQEPATVTIDIAAQRYLGEESVFDRSKFINVHSRYSTAVEDTRILVEQYDVGFGRFFYSPFSSDLGKPPYTNRKQLIGPGNQAIKRDQQDPAAKYRTRRQIVTDHPKNVMVKGLSPARAANYSADYFELFYDEQTMPMFYEPMNEPFVHAGEFHKDQERVRQRMAQVFGAIGKEFDRRGLPVKVVGYSSAWPSMELWDFGHWESRMKMFMDTAGRYMDGFSVHLYDGTNVTGQDNRRSGSNADAILDLIETYSMIKFGEVKPHALTEYGDIPKGFGPEYSDASASAHLNSINHLMFGFIERQDRILTSIPFITTRSPWFYNNPSNNFQPYGVDIFRPDPSKISNGRVNGFLKTPKILFFELWKDVRGDRVVSYADDPDIYSHVFVEGKRVHVCLNNLETEPRTVRLDHLTPLPPGTTANVRRLHVPTKQAAKYTDRDLDSLPTELQLEAHESVILRYDLPQPIATTKAVRSTPHYSKTHLEKIEAKKPIVFRFRDVSVGEGRAMLRMSISRKHDRSKTPRVEVNGQEVTVPNDWPGYDQANREDFFGAIPIPVPMEHLEPSTIVRIVFPDAGGRVSTVVLTTEVESAP
ncbi:MAG: T9SS C-terminal target domain-containing protein [Planctomycetota bacterium]